MENKILKFSEYLQIDKEGREHNKKIIESKDAFKMAYEDKTTYTFTLSAIQNNNSGFRLVGYHNEQLIYLDEEDLEYFKKKYLPKLEDEYQEELAKLKTKYSK